MRQWSVLIVDDSFLMTSIMKENIKEAFPDVKVFEADNGEAAQRLIARRHFDLVLCDWEMPSLKGNGLLQWLREDSSQKTIPFIMITGRRDTDSILEAKELGVTDYIVKPFTPEMLCHKVGTILENIGWSETQSPDVTP